MRGGDLRRWVVPLAVAAAFVLRLPGLLDPITSDEAGFTLVARTWDPTPDSLYGPHFVDRTPLLLAVFRAADLVGPVWGIRVLGAVGAAVTVFLVSRAARLVASPSAARWSAVLVAALVTTPLIDPVSVNGALLALPLTAGCLLLGLHAANGHRTVLASAAAGLLGMLSVGMKQNLVGGLVFAGVLLTVCLVRGSTLPRRRAVAALLALAAGAAVPVLGVLVWTLAAGVDLSTLWYAVYGFRADAAGVLSFDEQGAAYQRLGLLVVVALVSGMGAVFVGLLVQLPRAWGEDRAVTAATGAMLLVQVAGLAGGGSYWRDYLVPLAPTAGLAVAVLALRHAGRPGRKTRVIVAAAVASAAVGFAGWAVATARGAGAPDSEHLGASIERAARPGDTLVVFGGHAEIQFIAGLDTPYRHLWSLPMRTLDPEYHDLADILAGPDAPEWFVQWWYVGLWSDEGGARLREVIEERYELHAVCGDDKEVFVLQGADRPALSCDE